ncbi:MAG: hypothetical protein KAS30_05415, partial [Candidatus Diapherotrites archaeon]|nr:hypothetical protein [Candidatus Diapherotrites archaeon]
VWYRATDIDRRDIRLKPTKLKDTTRAFIATILLQQWMRDTNFGKFLNQWGRSLAKNGSCVLKFVEKDGMLFPVVINWMKVIIDSIDFENNPVIEVLEFTPAQLRKKKGYDQEMVEDLITAVSARETPDGEKKDTKAGYIKLYEIHGELPKSYITGKEEHEKEYVQQMQVISYVATDAEGEFDDFVLAKGREDKSPYILTHLIEEENRSQAIGAVEHLFEAQWMNNHTIKGIKDHLDLASKLIFQTADDTFVGMNAIEAIESGDILVHEDNMPLTQINNGSHDITQMQNFGATWKQLGNEITGISEAMLGQAPKSGTAWRQTEAVLSESHDLFELMTENKGIHIEEMMRLFILPFLKKQLKNSDEIVGILEDHDIKSIDSSLIRVKMEKKVRQDIKDSLIKGELPVELDVQATKEAVESELSEMGNMRSFVPSEMSDKDWNDYFDGFVWDSEVDVTGEASNTQAHMTTLTTVLQTIATNPAVLTDPNAKMIFNKILSMTGAVSPIEMSTTVS